MKNNLQEWANSHEVDGKMLWKGAWGNQIAFVRDQVSALIGAGIRYNDPRRDELLSVISTHRSKSITLPVYEFSRPDYGLRIILRNNFYNWKMSVICTTPIECNFDGLFHTTPPVEPTYTGDPLNPAYFEGFPEDLVFGYYYSDQRQFSAEIGTDYELITSLFLIMRSLGAIKAYRWHTKESHKKELEEETRQDKIWQEQADNQAK